MIGPAQNSGRSFKGKCALANFSALLMLLVLTGCREPQLDTYYGHKQIPGLTASVNGTDVLASMLEQQGHKVLARRTLISSQMESVDTVIWFPDDYAAPTAEVCDWFDNWLSERPGRTLVYVGRSFDAAPIYWRTVAPWVTAELAPEYRKRQREAEQLAYPPAAPDPDTLDCEWFALEPKDAVVVRNLAGDWSEDISAANAQISLRWRMEPHDQSKPLLATTDDVLVARVHKLHWPDDSQLLLVANGSFLLNLPLVNHEHRKLAGTLIASTAEEGKVVLLSSGKGGPPIDPPPTDNSLWRVFGAWPLNVVLLHFAVLGVIFCFARWPIFGRPRTPLGNSLSDFGKHVEAVGRLLRRTGDRNYALEKLAGGEESEAKSSRTATAKPKQDR